MSEETYAHRGRGHVNTINCLASDDGPAVPAQLRVRVQAAWSLLGRPRYNLPDYLAASVSASVFDPAWNRQS
eukprot:COSAG01_NODE_1792_length_9219_cov_4.501644_8_plen_72_part_00